MAERLVRKSEDQETIDDYLMYLRHLAAYQYSLSRVTSGRVIDLGCGTGYGTELLAERAKLVIGLDQAGYTLPNTVQVANARFIAASVCKLPIANASFDLAISFQVIEHIKQVDSYLEEACRVLSKAGLMILSTPNRNLRLWPLERPWNPYHVKEYSPTQLRLLLQKYFATVNIYGLQATPEIEGAERRRLRDARYWYYRQLLLATINKLPLGEKSITMARQIKRLLLPLKNRVNKTPEKTQPVVQSFRQTYSGSDFWISEFNISQRMDLIAVCQK